ncbi:25275_t:CDS:2 [Gigaspora rosea]|nr:25275_t:CDS:2 [Gigaspora rosea]
MNGMILNGSNWVQFRNHFEHAIQVYVPLDLLTTGYFAGNYNNGYNRIVLNQIAGLIGGNAAEQGAYNIHTIQNTQRGQRRRRHDWESVENGPPTILLDKTNFPEKMNEHFAAALTRGIVQGNLLCRDADGTSRQVSFRLWFDKVFITPKMIKEKQKQLNKMRFEPKYLIEIDEAANFQTKFMRDLALYRNNTSFLEGLQLQLEGMLPNGRHELEDYKSQMNLINNEITDTPAFFTALSRVYDYYKSGKVGEYFRNQSEKKQANFLNKQREFYDNEKKKKENRFKKNEFTIVPLRNMKCYNCGRKGHLMSDCRSKKQDKGYRKEMDIRTKEEEYGNPEKTIRNRKNQGKEKTHPSLLEPKKKDLRNHHFAQRTHQDNTKRNIDHSTKKNTRTGKCDVEEVEDPMVFNLEKSREKEDFDEYIRFTKYREQYHLENEYSSSDESQSYQEPEQYETSSESSESDNEYESYNLEKKNSEESENDYYF